MAIRICLPVPNKDNDVRHGSEVPFVLDLIPQASLQTYWINFARSGNPNGAGLPTRPRQDDAGTYIERRPDRSLIRGYVLRYAIWYRKYEN